MFGRARQWSPGMGLSKVVLAGVLVTGVAASVTAWFKNPVVGGVVAVVTAVVGVVVADVQKKAVERARTARDLKRRWAESVDSLVRPAVVSAHSIAALLRPDLEVVPYNNIHAEQLRALRKWALFGAMSLHFLTGSAGVGKTRTARELAKLLQGEEGWQCGIARVGKEVDAVMAAIVSGLPTLLIVEQESRHEAVAQALTALARQDVESRVRVLVVVRNSGVWRRRMTGHAEQVGAELVRAAEQTELDVPSSGPHDHRQQFRRAVSAFARARRIAEPTDRLGLVDADAPVVAVHVAALLTVLEAEFSSTRLLDRRRPCDRDVFSQLLNHEVRFWRLFWLERGLEPLPDGAYRQIVAVACLLGWGARDSNEPLRRIPVLVDVSAERLAHVEEWLEDLYPAVGGLLAAVLVTDVLADDPVLAEAVVTDLPVASVSRVISILGCAARELPAARPLLQQAIAVLPKDQLRIALDVACEIGDPLDHDLATAIDNADLDPEQLSALQRALGADVDAPWCALALLRARLRLSRSDRLRVTVLRRLIALLRDVGEYEEGIRHSRNLVQLLRRLVRRGAEGYVTELASALNHQASILHYVGRDSTAIGVSGEALKLARDLAERNAFYLGDLCAQLNNRGVILGSLGKYDRALAVVNDAVAVGRLVATSHEPEPRLAQALNTLAMVRLELEHPKEAIEPAQESVDCFRQAAATNWWYRSDLARALTNLGAVWQRLNDDTAAVRVLEDAVRCWRQVVFEKPHLTHGLVDALVNLGSSRHDLGRPHQALRAWQEAWPLARRLAQHDRRFTRHYLIVRCGLGGVLSSTGDHGMALKVLRETIDLGLDSAAGDRLYWPLIARAHDYLGGALRRADRRPEALTALRKGLAWWRKSSNNDPRHRADVVFSLYNIGELFTLGGDDQQAFEAYTQALHLAQELDPSSSCACRRAVLGDVVMLIRNRLRGVRGFNRVLEDGIIPLERLSTVPVLTR